MRRTNVYMVTYNNQERINENVGRFLTSRESLNPAKDQVQLFIINNHTEFTLKEEYLPHVGVLHNSMRLDRSCGHLARDYNAALMHGFNSLKEPLVEQVVCLHDDSLLAGDWYQTLKAIHETYTFYSGNYGCGLTSYLPEAVRKIGIWDERFCNIGYHEADYFLRAAMYNAGKSSINDHFGGRVLNPSRDVFELPAINGEKQTHISGTMPYHTVSRKVFEDKWGTVHPEQWETRGTLAEGVIPKKPNIPYYMYYPYFEIDIEDLEGKNYSYVNPGLENFKPEWN